jgi:hypothetical protein
MSLVISVAKPRKAALAPFLKRASGADLEEGEGDLRLAA